MRIYFVRHGESEANLLHVFSNRGWQHGLTARGHQQAQALADKLRAVPIKHIYTSPLMRAVQTAEILAQDRQVPITISDALREFDTGIYEGTSDAEGWQLYERVLEAWMRLKQYDERMPGGESWHDLTRRFLPFIEQLNQAYSGSPANLVLVSHGGICRCMLPLILTNIDSAYVLEHPMEHTAPIIAKHRANGWVCLQWGQKDL